MADELELEPGELLLGAAASISTLEMTEEEKAAAAERLRRRGAFGFARALEQDLVDAVD